MDASDQTMRKRCNQWHPTPRKLLGTPLKEPRTHRPRLLLASDSESATEHVRSQLIRHRAPSEDWYTQTQTDVSDNHATRTRPSRGAAQRRAEGCLIPGRRRTVDETHKKGPAARLGLRMSKKAGDERKRGWRGALRSFADLDRVRLETMQISHCALRVRGCREDEALVIGQDLQ